MGQAAAKVHVERFVPKQGVQIETDPKASSVSKATSMGDDEGAINALIEKLEVSLSVDFVSSLQPKPMFADVAVLSD